MSLRWCSAVIDCHDLAAQARWWAGVLDWQITHEAEDERVLRAVLARPVRSA